MEETNQIPEKRGRGRPKGSQNHERGRPLKKGQVLNPLGGKVHNKLLMQVRRLTKAEIAETGSMLLLYTKEEITELAKSKNATMLQSMLAAMVIEAHKSPTAFEKLLDRIVGKPKEKIEHSVPEGVGAGMAMLSNAEIRAKREKAIALLNSQTAQPHDASIIDVQVLPPTSMPAPEGER